MYVYISLAPARVVSSGIGHAGPPIILMGQFKWSQVGKPKEPNQTKKPLVSQNGFTGEDNHHPLPRPPSLRRLTPVRHLRSSVVASGMPALSTLSLSHTIPPRLLYDGVDLSTGKIEPGHHSTGPAPSSAPGSGSTAAISVTTPSASSPTSSAVKWCSTPPWSSELLKWWAGRHLLGVKTNGRVEVDSHGTTFVIL